MKSLMGPSVDPHLYNASQSDISTLDGADLIFYNGLDLEINMVKIFDQIGQSKPVLAVGDAIVRSVTCRYRNARSASCGLVLS